ncbi:hypothetical protein HNQ94_000422 [Salirhabdus euzebyi]|uniref:Phage-related protein n=1 Tax=Salirhabdus euzebyi TaxID=394506 RepID=A0A841PYG5_9BACI|nr:hypothetical protein [Salirhabdus euzebyi]MBB6452001.1 hypothetical protein [Salirhabdus euzebyi]
MIKEAIQYIVGLGNKDVVDVNLQTYATDKLHLIEAPTPDVLEVHSLSGLVDYLDSHFDGDDPIMIHIKSPTEVTAYSSVNQDYNRNKWITAQAMLPSFRFDNWYDTENFNIKLQSCFVKNDDRDVMLKVVGNITEDQVKTVSDDGVSQAVVAKVGVAAVGNVEVPNPVALAPYRTFVEVVQPESNFIFRMQSGPKCALFEADGGAWKHKAIENIRNYLTDSLQTEIGAGRITIIA